MGDNGHRENGRLKQDMYKSTQSQWLMHQPSMKQLMSIMAERDAALQERNMALNEKNKALEERDLVIMQRDTAMQERNEAIIERDNALAALHYRQNAMNTNNNSNTSCPPGCQIAHGIKHVHHPQMGPEPSYDPSEVTVDESVPLNNNFATENLKDQKLKSSKPLSPNKRPSKSSKKVKKEVDESNKMASAKSQQEFSGDEYKASVSVSPKPDWKGQEIGLNQVAFDESTMPAPVCSCTGVYRQCYKWGNGGWQSACCTNTISMYPLPTVPNKRHARVGGRKMSGSAFSKLLSRLADEGHDLSVPVDLRDHWAKHGTNRYVTIR